MEKMRFVLVVGQVKAVIRNYCVANGSRADNWIVNRANENGFFFDTKEELELFRKDVLEFAKRLYDERKKKEE